MSRKAPIFALNPVAQWGGHAKQEVLRASNALILVDMAQRSSPSQ